MQTKYRKTILPFLLLLPIILFAQHREKTFVKSFNLNGNSTVYFDLKGETEVKVWSEGQVRVLMTVQLENGSEAMLISLMKAGRYNIQSGEKDRGFSIFAPQLDKQVIMRNGQPLHEKITYTVYAPAQIQVYTRDEIGELTLSSF
ncbi:MAG: hypothetical protein ACE5FF_01850 [Saprospiraceae bacterium]